MSECAITILGHFVKFLLNVLVYTEYERAYPDDSSYHSSQDGDYVYSSPDDYSDSNDSY